MRRPLNITQPSDTTGSEVSDQKSAVGDQRSEVSDQRSAIRGLRSAFSVEGFLRTLAISALLLAGCSTPQPEPLHTPPPPAGAINATATRSARPLPQAWWTAFRDPELDSLIATARERNRDLAQAAARIEAAQARARLAGADAALHVTGSASATRARSSESTASSSYLPAYQSRFGASLQFAYEADLWGRIRALRQAAAKSVELSASERDTAEIALCAEVAKAHLSRLAVRRESAVLERQLAAYAETEKLLAARVDAGYATGLDVERVRVEAATRDGERAALREREQALANALALLCGEPAANSAATSPPPAEAVAPDVPDTLSLDLLEQRPDVAAKRAKWESSFQRVQAARAARYPSLSLTGKIGAEAERLEDLLDWRSRLWSLVAGLTAPLIDGGSLKASLDLERAALREAAAGYEAAVLTAYREVADALNALRGQAERQRAAERARDAARRALALSRERYDKGFVTYLEVVESDRALLAAERTLVQLQAVRQTATVDLIRALGIP